MPPTCHTSQSLTCYLSIFVLIDLEDGFHRSDHPVCVCRGSVRVRCDGNTEVCVVYGLFLADELMAKVFLVAWRCWYNVRSRSLSTICDKLSFYNLQSFSCLLPPVSKTHIRIVPVSKPVMLIVSVLGLGGVICPSIAE